MRRYEYECRTCGWTYIYTEFGREGEACQQDFCDGTIKRVYHAVAMTWPMSQRGH